MSDDPYVYPGTLILKNKFGLRNAEELDRLERRFATQRAREGIPTGDFDLKHLQIIHHKLFQDVYDWAGEIRTVEVAKGGQPFMFRQYIQNGMEDVHRRVRDAGYFKGSTQDEFASGAGRIIGDLNHVHPFREGNGRTQLFYLKQLTERAGHNIALERLDGQKWIEASIAANKGEYDSMSQAIRTALVDRAKSQEVTEKLTGRNERVERLREGIAKKREKDRDDWER
jgi:cell filamentation protein